MRAIRLILQTLRLNFNRLRHFGARRYCPVCESSLARFDDFGRPPRKEAQCPVCGCLERHRMVWVYLRRCTDLFDGRPKRMLHFAPEPQLSPKFRRIDGLDYVSVDFKSRAAMVHADITSLPSLDEMFDVVYASHVLEHVAGDRQAMRELFRVMKKGGWAILLVPIRGSTTLEDPSDTTPEARLARFGQHDHVRLYGTDFADRLRDARFEVSIAEPRRELGEHWGRRLGLHPHEQVFFCRK